MELNGNQKHIHTHLYRRSRSRDRPKFGFGFGYGAETGDIFSVGYGRNREARFRPTTTRFRREPKLSLLAPPRLCC